MSVGGTEAPSREAVIIGVGQIGGVLARTLESRGYAVVPVRRGESLVDVAAHHPAPEVVCIGVAEADFDSVLVALPDPYRDRALLVQNELRPNAWRAHGIVEPTVAVIWFETKKDKPLRVILSSPIAGPFAPELVAALVANGIAAHEVTPAELAFELAAKNAYILTTNVAGLRVGGVVRALLEEHLVLFRSVLDEVLAVEDALFDERLDHGAIEAKLREAIAADPDHVCTGRTAPARLERMLANADAKGLAVPTLRAIARGSQG